MRSCAHWLGWKCGIELGAAHEKVRTARSLESLPRIAQAMSRGELSYSKVRALTRVATPETEETLLMVALHGTSHHVEAVVRGFRRAQQAVELDREARQQANRGLTYRHDDDGSLCLQVRLPAEAGALVLRALQRASTRTPPTREATLTRSPARTFQLERPAVRPPRTGRAELPFGRSTRPTRPTRCRRTRLRSVAPTRSRGSPRAGSRTVTAP